MVSVIIPTYNYGSFIEKAIASVQSQTFQDFEIIVVDDGSTDDTAEVLAGIKDPRLTVIRTRNRGISAARNEGLKRASREYIAFLDADDCWLPDKLSAQIRIMKDEPSVCVIFTNFVRFDDAGHFPADQFQFYPELSQVQTVEAGGSEGRRIVGNAFVELINFSEVPAFPQTIMLRARRVRGLTFAQSQSADGTLLFYEDTHYFLRVCRRGDVAFISRPLVQVRRHESNTSKKTLERETRTTARVRCKLETLIRLLAEDLSPDEQAAVRKRLGRALLESGSACLREGFRWEAVRAYLSAFGYGDPLRALKGLATVPLSLTAPGLRRSSRSVGDPLEPAGTHERTA